MCDAEIAQRFNCSQTQYLFEFCTSARFDNERFISNQLELVLERDFTMLMQSECL